MQKIIAHSVLSNKPTTNKNIGNSASQPLISKETAWWNGWRNIIFHDSGKIHGFSLFSRPWGGKNSSWKGATKVSSYGIKGSDSSGHRVFRHIRQIMRYIHIHPIHTCSYIFYTKLPGTKWRGSGTGFDIRIINKWWQSTNRIELAFKKCVQTVKQASCQPQCSFGRALDEFLPPTQAYKIDVEWCR